MHIKMCYQFLKAETEADCLQVNYGCMFTMIILTQTPVDFIAHTNLHLKGQTQDGAFLLTLKK